MSSSVVWRRTWTSTRDDTVRDIRAFGAVLAGAKVHYHRAGSRRPSFSDHGKRIDIYDSRTRESVLAALQLSAQKWGTISVHGNREFMRTCVELGPRRIRIR